MTSLLRCIACLSSIYPYPPTNCLMYHVLYEELWQYYYVVWYTNLEYTHILQPYCLMYHVLYKEMWKHYRNVWYTSLAYMNIHQPYCLMYHVLWQDFLQYYYIVWYPYPPSILSHVSCIRPLNLLIQSDKWYAYMISIYSTCFNCIMKWFWEENT